MCHTLRVFQSQKGVSHSRVYSRVGRGLASEVSKEQSSSFSKALFATELLCNLIVHDADQGEPVWKILHQQFVFLILFSFIWFKEAHFRALKN